MPITVEVPDEERGGHALAGTVTLWVQFVDGRSDDDVLGFLGGIRRAMEDVVGENDRWMVRPAFG